MTFFVVVWTTLVFLSIAWYAALLFYIGIKGGKEIWQLIKELSARNADQPNSKS